MVGDTLGRLLLDVLTIWVEDRALIDNVFIGETSKSKHIVIIVVVVIAAVVVVVAVPKPRYYFLLHWCDVRANTSFVVLLGKIITVEGNQT